MKNMWPPQDQTFWYLHRDTQSPCRKNIHADVAIVGGGMAGLSAAQAFAERGKKVVLLEQYYCGSGASGKSSGFITPNAELSLTDFIHRYGIEAACRIWDCFLGGLETIKSNINQHKLVCDYSPEDALIVANSARKFRTELTPEYENLQKHGYKTALYTADTLSKHVGSQGYYGSVRYFGGFGINGYSYCQGMKKVLQQAGVLIFEETPVTAINGHTLSTMHAQITADNIIICTDRFAPQLGLLKKEIYQVQTFLMVSQELTEAQVRTIFPTENLMVWDSDLVYSYFRVTGDNRLLLGGGTLLSSYSSKAYHEYQPIIRKLQNYLRAKFPTLEHVQFEQQWPGLIGISKDIAPLAGRDKDTPHIYYACAATGLPIAAALGRYSAEHIVDGRNDLDAYFSPYRTFPIGGALQTIVGKKISFSLSALIKMYT